MKTILEQYNESCANEGDVVCPECGEELMKWYGEGYRYIESGKCPFCDCEGIEVVDDEPNWHDRCDCCGYQQDCRRDAALAQWEAEEQSRELLRYRCLGY